MMLPKTHIDEEFKTHFRNLKQVFLYITDECNLRCQHCLYKPDLTFHRKDKEIPLGIVLRLITEFKELGASKLSILGGEPTLYGASIKQEPLLNLINYAKDIGYEYVRIDSNGQFRRSLLSENKFKKIDEISFGLDGHTPQINDNIRGKGAFKRCVSNIKDAVRLDYNVDITTCIHKGFTKRSKNGKLLLEEMIEYASSLGVNRLNFHDLFKTGLPRDSWTGNLDFHPEEWTDIYNEIQKNIDNHKYHIPIRLPICFIKKEEFDKYPKYYGYCPTKMGERVLVHPNGIIRICSLMIGSPYGIARYYNDKIVWDKSPTNELSDFDLKRCTPCTNQNKIGYKNDLVPLCVSFKPVQNEFVWQEKLSWESRRVM